MKNKKVTYDIITTYLFFGILVIELIFSLIKMDINNIGNTILTMVTTILTWFILKKSKLRVSRVLYFISIIFIFLSMYIGKIRNAYFIFPNWDKFLHLSSGAITTLLGLTIIYRIGKDDLEKIIKPIGIIVFLFIFSVAVAGLWEIYEYTTDFLFGLDSQRGSLDDTMLDMISATIVTIGTCIPIYYGLKKKPYIIDKIMKN